MEFIVDDLYNINHELRNTKNVTSEKQLVSQNYANFLDCELRGPRQVIFTDSSSNNLDIGAVSTDKYGEIDFGEKKWEFLWK